MTGNSSPPHAPPDQFPGWPSAMATVLRCHYETRAGRALAFGLPSSRHFRITYNYWAGDSLHEAEFFSEKAVPVGTLMPIRYDPTQPHQSRHAADTAAAAAPVSRLTLVLVGLAGSAVLTLGWLLLLHGCAPGR
jgi:hypothetical protein